MYLDMTYFQGELYVPGYKYSDSGSISDILNIVGDINFDWYIQEYEKSYLIRLIGKSNYDKLIKNASPDSEHINQWTDLRDMIFNVSNGFKTSPAANYVYFFFMRNFQSQTSPTGEVKGTQDHTHIVSPYGKLVRVWNRMVEMSNRIHRYLCDNKDKYDDFPTYDFRPINEFGI